MALLKYNGTVRRRITWNSMGKGFTYVVNPGDKIVVPEDQVNNATGCAPFIIISSLSQITKDNPVIVKKKIRIEEPVIKVIKTLPVVEVPEEVKEEVSVESVEVNEEVPEVPVESVEVLEEIEIVLPEEDALIRIDYTSFRKAQLKAMCSERGLNTNGNRDDLIARLVADDQGVVLE